MYAGSIAVMRSCSWPRGAYQSIRPRIRTSVPSVMRTASPAALSERLTGSLLRSESITDRQDVPAKSGSVSVK